MVKTAFKKTKTEWNKLGLKCGIEIHQQLLTERKLFCRCPAGLYTSDYDARVIRHMRPTLSELGEYDGTALMEFKTQKNITYLLDRRSVCTYETDDTPPFEINKDAVDIALEIAMILGCKIVGEMHVIRKQYLDGSIPTGFQRTAILGISGSVPFKGRDIGIIQISIEEDSCREISDIGHNIVFKTDRLSMPLIEVVTDPDMTTPEEAAEVTRLIARVMRATGRVRRGHGAGRQDVNVSVTGGTRIEIKGVPSISLIPGLVGGEGVRQRSLLDIKDKAISEGLDPNDLESRFMDMSWSFSKTKFKPMINAIGNGNAVKAIRINGMREHFSSFIGSSRTFADDIADRVRVIACLDKMPVMIHSGNYQELGIEETIWRSVRKRLRAKASDAVVVLFGPEKDVDLGLQEVLDRVKELFEGIPSETRQVIENGETGFERILPGPDRMYPDTDSPPMAISTDWLDSIRSRIGEPIWEIDARLADAGLPEDVVDKLGISPMLDIYDEAVKNDALPMAMGELLTRRWTALEREGVGMDKLDRETILGLVDKAVNKQITYDGVSVLVADAVASPDKSIDQLIEYRGFAPVDDQTLKEQTRIMIEKVPAPNTQNPQARIRYYMGRVMPEFFGSVLGQTVRRTVEKVLGAAK